MKKIISCLLAILIVFGCFSVTAFAENDLKQLKLDAPSDFFYSVRQEKDYDTINLYYIAAENMIVLANYAQNNKEYLKEHYGYDNLKIYIQNEWKTGTADWVANTDLDSFGTEGRGFEIDTDVVDSHEIFCTSYPFHCQLLGVEFGENNNLDYDKLNLELRCRYMIELYKADKDGKVVLEDVLTSPWSEAQKVSTKSKLDIGKSYDVLEVESVQSKLDTSNSLPYISFKIKMTPGLKKLILATMAEDSRQLQLFVERKLSGGNWEKNTDLYNIEQSYGYGERRIYVPKIYSDTSGEVSYRIFYLYESSKNSPLTSFVTNYSDILTYESTTTEVEEPTTEPATPTEKAPFNIWILIAIIAGVVIVGLIIFFIVKRRKDEDEEEE